MPNPTVPKLWPDSTIVCVASGPSLTQEDVSFVHGKAPVIAVNDGVRCAPWADVLYSGDRMWYPFYRGVPKFSGMKYGIGTTVGKRNPFPESYGITVLRNTGDQGLELHPGGLRNGRNSGYSAINLAVHFGAKRIILLGYNMGRRSGEEHFFGSHPVGLNSTSDNLFGTFRRLFATLVQPLKEAGVEVLNCTPKSALDAFPIVSLEEALSLVEA